MNMGSQWFSIIINGYQDISRWSIIRISINMAISLSHFGHGFSRISPSLTSPPFLTSHSPPSPRWTSEKVRCGLPHVLGYGRTRVAAGCVWCLGGETRWVTSFASGSSNGHVSRQRPWKQSSETLGIFEILLDILDGKLMAKAYDFKHPKWLNSWWCQLPTSS